MLILFLFFLKKKFYYYFKYSLSSILLSFILKNNIFIYSLSLSLPLSIDSTLRLHNQRATVLLNAPPFWIVVQSRSLCVHRRRFSIFIPELYSHSSPILHHSSSILIHHKFFIRFNTLRKSLSSLSNLWFIAIADSISLTESQFIVQSLTNVLVAKSYSFWEVVVLNLTSHLNRSIIIVVTVLGFATDATVSRIYYRAEV